MQVNPLVGAVIRRGVFGWLVALAVAAGAPQMATAAGWSAVNLPKGSGLNAVFCRSSRWCEAVGTSRNQVQAEHWNGSIWSIGRAPARPRRSFVSVFSGIACASQNSCEAVGEWTTRGNGTWEPLIEHWNGSRWSIQHAVKPPAPKGLRSAHTYLNAVACPAVRVCFAVGNIVAVGTGNSPGTPLIERWDGSRWHLQSTPRAIGPLLSISCSGSRACTAVGAKENVVGPQTTPVDSSVALRWNGTRWSLEAVPVPPGATGSGLLGVSCMGAAECGAVGSAQYTDTYGGFTTPGVDHAIVADWQPTGWRGQTLPFPAGIYRSTPTPSAPRDSLSSLSCASSVSCAAVGQYVATNGAIGPLVAVWNGKTWTQTVLRRGPVGLKSVSCPSSGWCMAVGPVAERYSG